MAKLLSGTRIYGNATVDTNLTVGGNINAGNIAVNTISANSLVGINTTSIPEGSNLYYTDARVINAVTNTTLSNLTVSGNITGVFVGDGSGVTNVTATGFSGNTSGVAEGTNLYYTNARVDSYVTPLLNQKADNVDLTTANVAELDNLYYTNTRVDSYVAPLLDKKADNVDLTTANVAELDNLYYTNARVDAWIAPNLASNLVPKANVVDLTTANVAERNNLYYTNTRVDSYVTPFLNLKANVADLTTSNVIEGNNLYYTNARVRSTLSGGTGVTYDKVTGQISIGQDVSTSSGVTFGSLAVTGNTIFYGNVTTYGANNLVVSDNMIYLNDDSNSNPDIGIAANYNDGTYQHAGFFRDASDGGKWKVYDSYLPEPDANIFIDTSDPSFKLADFAAKTVYANVVGNVTGFVSSIGNFSTSDLAEGSNKYFTDSRARDAITNTTLSNLTVSGNVTAAYFLGDGSKLVGVTATGFSGNTTGVLEGQNLYYTNARVDAWIAPNLASNLVPKANVVDLTTANVAELNNLYYTNARVQAYIQPSLDAKADNSDLTTANIAEVDNLYYTNARVDSYVTPYLNLKANVVDLTTSNVTEGTQLYYTNARVDAYVTPFLNLKANVVDLTTSNVTEGSQLYYTNARVDAWLAPNLAANLVPKANVVDLTTSNVTEGSQLYYTNARVHANVLQTLVPYATINYVDGSIANLINGAPAVLDTLYELANALGNDASFATTVTNTLAQKVDTVDFTTANIVELTNLFYTEARANGAIDARVNKAFVDALGVDATTLDGLDSTAFARTGDLTTSNIAEGTNLYYTNARVEAYLVPSLNNKANVSDLTTSNVAEGSQLYYTNARVNAYITPALNLKANVSDLTSGNITETNNLFYTNARVDAWIAPNLASNLVPKANVVDLTTANVAELNNLYYTNARVYSNVIGLFAPYETTANVDYKLGFKADNSDLTTANVAELDNLYYTNARVHANVTETLTAYATKIYVDESVANLVAGAPAVLDTLYELAEALGNDASFATTVTNSLATKAKTTDLTTANVAELTNLYYTNSRVYSNVIGLFAPYETTANVDSKLVYKANVVDLTTSNVVEGTNLYFTPGRAVTAVENTTLSNLTVSGNVSALYFLGDGSKLSGVTASGFSGNTSGILEGDNLFYTNARVYSNVIGLFAPYETTASVDSKLVYKANVVDLTTSNVVEGNNLYYTNERVYSNVIGLFAPYETTASVNAKLVYKANVVDLTTSNVVEGSQLYYTNARVYSNVIGLFAPYETKANVALKANIVDLTTSNVVEGSQLYYTNARVHSNVVSALATYATKVYVDQSVANLVAGAPAVLDTLYELAGALGNDASFATTVTNSLATKAKTTDLTTANVIELNNLYYTEARANASINNVVDKYYVQALNIDVYNTQIFGKITNAQLETPYVTINGVTTSLGDSTNIAATLSNSLTFNDLGNGSSSTIFDGSASKTISYNTIGAAPNSFVITSLAGKVNYSDLTTSNIAELDNLYYTNARVYSNVIGLFAPYETTASVNGKLALKANLTSLTTANVTELNNLYYTNARVYSNVIGLFAPYATVSNVNLKANISQLTTANVVELNNLYYTNARVYSNIIAALPTYGGDILLNNLTANGRVTFNLPSSGTTDFTIASGIATAFKTRFGTTATNQYSWRTNMYYDGANWQKDDATRGAWRNNHIVQTTDNNSAVQFSYAPVGTTTAVELMALNGTGNLTIRGNIITTNGVFIGDGSGLSNINAGVFSGNTDTIVEGANNLYYSNARVYSNVIGLFAPYETTANVDSKLVRKANVVDLTTSNVAELNNLYYTNARVYSNVIGLFVPYELSSNVNSKLAGKANVTDLTTSNVVEGNNLYYTNARVRTALSGGTGVTYNPSTGAISIGQDVSTTSSVIFNDLRVNGNAVFYGNVTTYGANNLVISDNMIYLNDGDANSNPDLGIAGNYNDGSYKHTGFFRDASDGNWKVYDSYTLEPDANVFIDTSHPSFRLANIQANVFIGDLKGNVIGSMVGTVSSISNFSTSDLREGSNLYYTNARVYSNVIGLFAPYATIASLNLKANIVDLTTSNVVEGNNLYYTNTRVHSNVVAALSNYTGTINGTIINASNVNTNNLIANTIITGGSGGNIEGANYITANYILGNVISPSTVQAQYFVGNGALLTGITAGAFTGTTFDIPEGGSNLYYTNARVYSNVIGLFAPYATVSNVALKANIVDLTTSNVTEGSQLYFTNARVYANVLGVLSNYVSAANLAVKANVYDLTTSNVVELNNLYYTNSRVYANVIALLPTYTGFISGVFTGDGSGLTGVSAASFTGNTSVIPEGANLYYTNARVYANVVSMLPTFTGNIRAGNIIASGVITGANGSVGGTITGASLIQANILSAFTWNNLYTSNVAESGSSLYFSNTRVQNYLAGVSQDIVPVSNNVINLGSPTKRFNKLYLAGNTIDLGGMTISETSGELVVINQYGNVVLQANGIAGVNSFNNLQGDITLEQISGAVRESNVLITDYITETGSNLFYSNDRVYANVSMANISIFEDVDTVTSAPVYGQVLTWTGTVWAPSNVAQSAAAENANVANSVGTLSNFTTTDLAEGNNLYYTNARVYSNIIQLGYATTTYVNQAVANIVNGAPAVLDTLYELANALGNDASFATTVTNSLATKARTSDLTTANVIELTNLYYTNARVDAYITPTLNGKANVTDLTTSNVIEGTRLYYSNDRVYSNVIGLFGSFETKSNVALKANVSQLTTANVVELTNLYYTNARVYSNVIGLFGAYATVSNVNAKANIVDLTTSNVVEGTNLYYTNSRVRANVISLLPTLAGVGIAIDANGIISANVSSAEISVPMQEFIGDAATKIFTLNRSVTNATNVLLLVDGLVQTPTTDYSISGTTLTLTDAPATGSNVVVRYPLGLSVSTTAPALNGGTGVSVVGSNISIGQNVDTTANVTFASLTITGNTRFTGNVVGANIQANVFIGDISGNVLESGNSFAIGYREVPQRAANTAYTFINDDRSKHVYYTGADANVTIPADDSTTGGTFPVGAVLTVINNGSGNVTLTGTPTLFMAGNTTSGSRVLGAKGMASLIKVAANTWFISGAGLT